MSHWGRCVILLLLVLTSGLTLPTLADATAKRPNILWIVSEDNGPFLRCYGCKEAKTPHLDEFAAQGVLYWNAFANVPVCAPARSTLVTGVYAPSMGTQHMRSTNAVPSEHIKFFPQYLRDAGYYACNNSKTDYNLRPYQSQAWNQMTKGDYARRAKDQPFFAVYNLGDSHESSLHKPLDRKVDVAGITIPPYHPNTPEIRRNWAMYHKIIAEMDHNVGKLLRRLNDEGLADDTIVFYFSDHGGILPRSKRFLYDSGVHVPLIVRFGKNFSHLAPSQAGAKTDRLVSFVDFAPTVLSLARLKIPDYMQGKAFLGPAIQPERDYVFCSRDRMGERYDMSRAVRDKRFKYIRNYNPHRIYGEHLDYAWRMPAMQSWEAAYKAGKCTPAQSAFWELKPVEELYDIDNDPWEVKNLANDPRLANTITRMRRASFDHLMEVYDSGFIPEGEMVTLTISNPTYNFVRDRREYPLSRIITAAELATEGKAQNLARIGRMLGDRNSIVRYWGAVGCVTLGVRAKSLAPELAKMLDDKSPNVRIAAAEALISQGQNEIGLKVLTSELNSQNEWVALHAMNVLSAIGPKAKPVFDQIRAKASKDSYLGRAAKAAQ